MAYDLYGVFDIEKHKETFVNYLEVIIDENGTVMYAVPSHQKKLEHLAADKFNCTVEDIQSMCPPNMYFDYMTWLLELTNAIAVWTDFEHHGPQVTAKQRAQLRQLKLAGIYKGAILRKAGGKQND